MNDIPDDWEPGHNIKWQSGSDPHTRQLAAAILMLIFALGSFVLVCVALSSCATCVNRGDAFSESDHIADPDNMIYIVHQIDAAHSVYWGI